MSRAELRAEFSGGVHGGVDLAAQSRLGAGKRRDDLAERRTAEDEQVHVARRPEPAMSGRSVDGGDVDSVRQREQGVSDLIDESRSLREDALQLFEDRRRGVGLVEDLIPPDRAPENSRGGEL